LGSVGGVILLAAAVALVVLIKLHMKAKAARYKSFYLTILLNYFL
jgi:hypothetical protein